MDESRPAGGVDEKALAHNYAFDNPVYFIDPDGMMGCPPGEDCSSKFGIFKLELKETLKTVGKNINNALKDLGKALTPKYGIVLTGGKGDGKKDSISDEPDREAPADAESIDVSPVVALSEAFGPQLEGVAEGARITTELFKVIDDKTQSGNSSNKGTISDTGNDEVSTSSNKEVSTSSRDTTIMVDNNSLYDIPNGLSGYSLVTRGVSKGVTVPNNRTSIDSTRRASQKREDSLHRESDASIKLNARNIQEWQKKNNPNN